MKKLLITSALLLGLSGPGLLGLFPAQVKAQSIIPTPSESLRQFQREWQQRMQQQKWQEEQRRQQRWQDEQRWEQQNLERRIDDLERQMQRR